MATVTKDFRVKNGLIVEGTTGTINGNNILTTASSVDSDFVSEGTTNLYFTDARAKNSAANLLTNATLSNITITGDGDGLVITAENGVADSTTDDLSEGTTNLYFTAARAQTAVAGDISSAIEALETDDIEEGTTNLYFTDQRAVDAVVNGSVDTDDIEEGATNLYYTDARVENVIAASDTDDLSEGTTNLYFTDQRALDATNSAYDAAGSASTAESNANSYTDDLIGDVTVDGTSGNTVTDRIATAVSNLVDSAPGALDTLNELAAALGDDANFSTTVTNAIGEKVAKAGDTMTGFLTLHANPENNLHAATKQYVDNAVSTGVGDLDSDGVPEGTTNLYFTDQRAVDAVVNGSVDTDDIEEGATNLYYTDARVESVIAASDTDDVSEGTTNLYFTDQRAVDALEAVVPNFTEVDINSVATQVAATINLADTNQTASYTFDSGSYRSAKFIVKAAYGTHTEVSEILVTLDTSDNIAITEYAIVSTNGNLVDVTAGMNGSDVEILATAITANTDVTVVGTLIA
jgi:hypothetical protein